MQNVISYLDLSYREINLCLPNNLTTNMKIFNLNVLAIIHHTSWTARISLAHTHSRITQ